MLMSFPSTSYAIGFLAILTARSALLINLGRFLLISIITNIINISRNFIKILINIGRFLLNNNNFIKTNTSTLTTRGCCRQPKLILGFASSVFQCLFQFPSGFVFFHFWIRAIFMVENRFSKFLFCNKSQNFKVLQIAF